MFRMVTFIPLDTILVVVMQNQTPLRKARLALGLTTAEAGHYVHVTRKTWETWEALEANGKPVPKASTELFFTKLEQMGKQKGSRELVAIFFEDPLSHQQSVIDVVADDNYLGIEDFPGGQKIIKSMAIDRNGRPYVHRTVFDPRTNTQVARFCERHKPLV